MSEDDKVGTKSLINAYLRPSTKENFKFFCDVCLTKFEIDMADSESKRLETVEGNITSIKSELEAIKRLLKNSKPNTTNSNHKKDNIWFNQEKLISTKVVPTKPLLVIDNILESNSEKIEKVIIDHQIPVTNSYKNKTGALVLECDTPDSREKYLRVNLHTKNGHFGQFYVC